MVYMIYMVLYCTPSKLKNKWSDCEIESDLLHLINNSEQYSFEFYIFKSKNNQSCINCKKKYILSVIGKNCIQTVTVG